MIKFKGFRREKGGCCLVHGIHEFAGTK